jgi:hypothetical protein
MYLGNFCNRIENSWLSDDKPLRGCKMLRRDEQEIYEPSDTPLTGASGDDGGRSRDLPTHASGSGDGGEGSSGDEGFLPIAGVNCRGSLILLDTESLLRTPYKPSYGKKTSMMHALHLSALRRYLKEEYAHRPSYCSLINGNDRFSTIDLFALLSREDLYPQECSKGCRTRTAVECAVATLLMKQLVHNGSLPRHLVLISQSAAYAPLVANYCRKGGVVTIVGNRPRMDQELIELIDEEPLPFFVELGDFLGSTPNN